MPIYKSIDTQWYNDFYGQKSNDRFHIILSMSNGPGNYGPSVTDKENIHNVFSVMGAWVTDSVGMVVYPPELILPILIHEFNHSFINFDPEMFRTSGELDGESNVLFGAGGAGIAALRETIAETTRLEVHPATDLLPEQQRPEEEPWLYLRAIAGVFESFRGGKR